MKSENIYNAWKEHKSQTDLREDFADDVMNRINATGEAFFSGTNWNGRQAMRVSVVNWRTNEQDVQRAIAAAASVLGAQ